MNFTDLLDTMTGGVPFYLLAFIIVLSILVFVHEWGHYIIARLCGVRVEMFSIGFGKELFGYNDKHGTRWKVSMIPLGGYVKLFGDVDPASAGHDENVKDGETQRPMSDTERKTAFFAQPVWKRAAVVIAGPAINYIFAFILLAGLFFFNGQPITPPVAAAIVAGSSADQNGFLPHDRVISIDGKPIQTFEDIRREMIIALDLKKHFVVERDNALIDIYAAPQKVTSEDRFGFKQSRGLLGLISPRQAVWLETIAKIDGQIFDGLDEDAALKAKQAAVQKRFGKTFAIEVSKKDADGEAIEPDILTITPLADFNVFINDPQSDEHGILFLSNVDANVFVQHGVLGSMRESLKQTWVVTRGTVEALGQMVTGTRSATELGGIIRIGALAGDMAKQGLVALIMFTALLSINLGLINLFPIPLLDGGHLVFYLCEALMGRPVPERIQEYAFRAGLVFLVGIMAFANLNDIMQLIL